MGHRPLYCSAKNSDECNGKWPPAKKYLEKILCEGGVDVVVGAHQHQYERMFPVYDNRVYNGTATNPYDNPPCPAYLVAGAAGCQEDLAKFSNWPWSYSAFRERAYGVGVMTVHNYTHMSWHQYNAKNGWPAAPVDQMYLIRSVHHQRHPVC